MAAITKVPKGIELITKFVLGQFAKRSAKKTGIATLKKASDSIVQSNVQRITKILQDGGVDINKLKSTDDVLKYMNINKSLMDQQLKQEFKGLGLGKGIKSLEKKEPTVESLAKGEKYTDERGRTWDFGTKDRPFPGANLKVVPKETEAEMLVRMKRQNKEAAERLRKKKLDEEPDDLASGGVAGQLHLNRPGYFAAGPVGKGLVKGGKWFLKSLNDTKEQIKLLDITLSQKKQYLDQIEDQIRRINAGEPIPDEVIQTIRSDPKFKGVWQNKKSSDPDLREMEEVLLEYGKKHAEGGIAGQLHLNRPAYKSGLLVKLKNLLKPKPKPKSNRLSELDVADLKKKHGLDPESLKKDEEAFKLRLQQILAKHSTKHAKGGRVSYTKGGLAHVLGV